MEDEANSQEKRIMSKLPDQVRRQAEEADRLMKEMHGNTEENGQQGIPTAAPAPDSQAPGVQTQEGSQTQPLPGQQAPASEQGIPTAAPTDVNGTPRQEEDYKQKYFVLKGKYDSEVPRYRAALADTERQLAEKDKQLVALQQGSPVSAQQPGSTPTPDLNSLEEDYGPEIANMARQNAQLAQQNADLMKRFEALEGGLHDVSRHTARTAQDRFEAALSDVVPNWQEIDNDLRFEGWLQEKFLKNSLIEAARAHNAKRVGEIMQEFLKEFGGEKPKAPATPQGQQPAGKVFTPPPLNTQVAPNTFGGTPPDTNQNGRIYSVADVKEFYAVSGLGKYPFKFGNTTVESSEMMRAYDNDITLANVEGRIR